LIPKHLNLKLSSLIDIACIECLCTWIKYWEEVEALDFTQLAERAEPTLLRVDLWSPHWKGVLLEDRKTTSAMRQLVIKELAP
jgi:hypothetical protein